jgi:hypothetical protein
MNAEKVSWVVYLMTIHNRADKLMAVCEQSEWEAMELNRPGYHQLVREGIVTENEAELIARGPAKIPNAWYAEALNLPSIHKPLSNPR